MQSERERVNERVSGWLSWSVLRRRKQNEGWFERETEKQKVLDDVRSHPKSDTHMFRSSTGGYMTLGQLDQRAEHFEKVKLTAEREKQIIDIFTHIIGMKLSEAIEVVAKDGFTIHVLYVGGGTRMQAQMYDPTMLGVRIIDCGYSWVDKKPSSEARIDEIVDVGGLDENKRGLNL